jgi:DNA-binding ferritin-like protein
MDRGKIDRLIIGLMAISHYAKDIHYNCSGANFYGNHLFADRIHDNLSDYIDQLKEICLLGHKIAPLHSSEYLKSAAEIVPSGADFRQMRDLMIDVLEIIEHISGVSKGDDNLIGAIAQDLQNNIGLINIMYEDK